MKTIALSLGALCVCLGGYVAAFKHWPTLSVSIPAPWVNFIDPVFEPAEKLRLRVDQNAAADQWRDFIGMWYATYPEGFEASFEIVEIEYGLFRMNPTSPIPFLDQNGCDILLDIGGGALIVTGHHSSEIFPPDEEMLIRVSKLPLDDRPVTEYMFEREKPAEREQDGDLKPDHAPS